MFVRESEKKNAHIILKTRRKHYYTEYWFVQYVFCFQLLYAIKTVNLLIKTLICHKIKSYIMYSVIMIC